jgi:hypothetical protein
MVFGRPAKEIRHVVSIHDSVENSNKERLTRDRAGRVHFQSYNRDQQAKGRRS